MAIELYDDTDHDGLFDIQGKAFAAQEALNLARGTTIPVSVLAVLDQFEKLTTTAALANVPTALPAALASYRSSGSSLAGALQAFSRDLLIEMAAADVALPAKTLAAALAELIDQMIAGSESVDASAITVAASAGGSNTGNGVLLATTKRGDGLVQENALAEIVNGTVISETSQETASIQLLGEEAESNRLSENWPRGSGCNKQITAVDAASNLLLNSDFEDEDDVADAPDDWIVSVGTIGTTLKMTNVEVQTVVMSDDPTSGHYLLHYTNPAGKVQTTIPLAYNATSSAVQSALRSLKGLEEITVAQTGTTPNLTHTITFTGAGGNVAQLTSTDNTDVGTIAHNTTVAGTAQVFAGSKALELDSDGSQLTTINQRLTTLKASTAYAFSLWAIADVVPVAGVITIDLVDGIGGSVIADDQSVNNALTFNCDDLTTGWQHLSALVSGECVFRTPAVFPPLVYLRIRISTAISSGTSVFLDHAALTEMQLLYAGGPYVAAFSGSDDFAKGDAFTVTVTNDRAGEVQEYYQRNFDMAGLGLLLPSNAAGSETIPDTVI